MVSQQICPSCATANSTFASTCRICRTPLSPKTFPDEELELTYEPARTSRSSAPMSMPGAAWPAERLTPSHLAERYSSDVWASLPPPLPDGAAPSALSNWPAAPAAAADPPAAEARGPVATEPIAGSDASPESVPATSIPPRPPLSFHLDTQAGAVLAASPPSAPAASLPQAGPGNGAAAPAAASSPSAPGGYAGALGVADVAAASDGPTPSAFTRFAERVAARNAGATASTPPLGGGPPLSPAFPTNLETPAPPPVFTTAVPAAPPAPLPPPAPATDGPAPNWSEAPSGRGWAVREQRAGPAAEWSVPAAGPTGYPAAGPAGYPAVSAAYPDPASAVAAPAPWEPGAARRSGTAARLFILFVVLVLIFAAGLWYFAYGPGGSQGMGSGTHTISAPATLGGQSQNTNAAVDLVTAALQQKIAGDPLWNGSVVAVYGDIISSTDYYMLAVVTSSRQLAYSDLSSAIQSMDDNASAGFDLSKATVTAVNGVNFHCGPTSAGVTLCVWIDGNVEGTVFGGAGAGSGATLSAAEEARSTAEH